MSITAGDILKIVSILSWLDGDIMQNVFSAVVTGAGGPWDDQDIVEDATDWMDTVFATMGSLISDEVDGSEVVTYVYDPIDDDYDEVGSEAWTFNPIETTDQLPRAVALLINCKTSDPDVSGKKYIGGMCEDNAVDGLFDATAIAAAANWAAEWVTPFVGAVSGADWAPGVWSPTETNFFLMTGTVVIPTIPAYQRRRKNNVGI